MYSCRTPLTLLNNKDSPSDQLAKQLTVNTSTLIAHERGHIQPTVSLKIPNTFHTYCHENGSGVKLFNIKMINKRCKNKKYERKGDRQVSGNVSTKNK